MLRLFAWLAAEGALFSDMYIKLHGNQYRTVHASRAFKKGEQVLLVPRKCLLTLEDAGNIEIG